MGLGKDLKKQAMNLSQKAMEKIFADEKRAMKIAAAVGTVQKGKQALDKGQEDLMRALNLAPKSDFKVVGKQLSSLKRRLRELDEKLDELKA
jgi:glycosyltransferase involved in cell wall biosynthesis